MRVPGGSGGIPGVPGFTDTQLFFTTELLHRGFLNCLMSDIKINCKTFPLTFLKIF